MKVKVGDLYSKRYDDELNIVHRSVFDNWCCGYKEKVIIPVDDTYVVLTRKVNVHTGEIWSIISDKTTDEYVDLPEVEYKEEVGGNMNTIISEEENESEVKILKNNIIDNILELENVIKERIDCLSMNVLCVDCSFINGALTVEIEVEFQEEKYFKLFLEDCRMIGLKYLHHTGVDRYKFVLIDEYIIE